LPIDLEPLRLQADATDARIAALMEQLGEGEGDGDLVPPPQADEPLAAKSGDPTWDDPAPPVDPPTKRHLDELFEAARRDRAVAPKLKEELDRLGLFEAYEDRFLDLFREA
jgi:hypothetical protein